ncbi:MAG: hypothetical protein H7329_06345, partial [Opitutaceae bacterium]|nr:hypothetical protein [Cytophagales bacterium]
YIIQAVKNANKLPLFSRLSFRNYYQRTSSLGFDQPPVNGGLNQENGSLAYNYTLDKIIKEMTPMFWDSIERRGYLDFYPFTLNNQSWLIDGDGVHFYGTTAFHIREFWADYAFKFLYTGQKAPVMIYKEIVPGLTLKADSAVLKAEHSLLEKDVWDARILVNQVSNRTSRLAFEDRLAKILIGVAPSITLQPFGKTIKEGNSVTFIITSSGTAPLSYQWKRNNVSIPGAIQASYTYTPVLADNGSVFICTVTNSFGSVISSSASLSVTPLLPVISQHPASISVLVGANTTFSVIASGSGLTYQWQKDGVNIASAFQSTYTLNGITQSMTGSNFRCLITNTTGTLISNNAVLTVTPAASVNGLTGRYYSNTYGGFSNTVAFTRIDPTVDFYWPLAPNAAVSADQFSVRWIGRIKPQYSQLYTFYTKSDDGVRLWINNQLVIDKWLYQNEKEYSGSISLVADKLYDIKIEYFDGNGGATCRLYWSGPSLIRQIVPTSALFPESNLRRGEFENESNEANIEVKNTGLIYPTYVEDFINIDNYEIGNLASICTIEGLVIKEVFIMLSHEKLNVADLKPGTYFVRQGGLTNLFIKKH